MAETKQCGRCGGGMRLTNDRGRIRWTPAPAWPDVAPCPADRGGFCYPHPRDWITGTETTDNH